MARQLSRARRATARSARRADASLLYAQDPAAVRRWVDAVARRWQFEQIVPAHFEAPIRASPSEFARAFAFLEDERIDAFPAGDTARGLRPIARIASSALRASVE